MPQNFAAAGVTQGPLPHILLVEDQERAARGLQELLHLEGFRVTCAGDGPTGLHVARASRVDAVVLDLKLPGMDGFAVCRALRAHEPTSRVPIVMLTGLGDTPSKIQGFDTGADDYLVKPVPARELAARLRKLILARLVASSELHQRRLQAIGEIATAVGHEISEPLTAAFGTLDLALLHPGVPPDLRRQLAQCRNHLWQIASTVAQLADAGGPATTAAGPDRMVYLAPEGHA